MNPTDAVSLALRGATTIADLIARAVADRGVAIEEARAAAHVAVDALIDDVAGLRARVEADDRKALAEVK